MRLSAKAIVNYANINSFSYGNQWIVRAGDPLTLYFQIVDLDQGPANVIGQQNFTSIPGGSPLQGNVGLRYIVGVGSSNTPSQVTVTFPSIDSAGVITAIATPADASDLSIWKVVIPANQQPNAGNIQFAIQEGSATRRFNVLQLLNVEFPENDGSC